MNRVVRVQALVGAAAVLWFTCGGAWADSIHTSLTNRDASAQFASRPAEALAASGQLMLPAALLSSPTAFLEAQLHERSLSNETSSHRELTSKVSRIPPGKVPVPLRMISYSTGTLPVRMETPQSPAAAPLPSVVWGGIVLMGAMGLARWKKC